MKLENKYTIIKNSDIEKLNIDCQMYLKHVIDSINNKNSYVIVNLDEPYAKDIIKLIEEHEKKINIPTTYTDNDDTYTCRICGKKNCDRG